MVLKIAHRGFCKTYNGNTLNSIKDAIDNNFDMIELDIQLDKNDKIILYHDIYYKDQLIDTLSYQDIVKEQPDVLLLSTLFKTIDYQNIKLYFDLKGSDKVAHELDKLFTSMNITTTNIWIASFNLNHIEILNNKTNQYKLGLITENNFPINILSAIERTLQLSFVVFSWVMLNQESVQYLQNKEIYVFTYTIDDKKTLQFIEHYNVDGLITDILL
jgi:glycerophosphoryl diester phosphodiesterase